jgi:D-hexose-6-phosphate mutarotase
MIDDLNNEYGKNGITFSTGEGGLPKADIENAQGTAEIYLHGAHVTAFQPIGEAPVLWMSEIAEFNPPKPIRGGVPICWPWFGGHPTDPDKPQHGFVRNRQWSVRGAEGNGDGPTTLIVGLCDDAESREIWPCPFDLEFRITVGRELKMELRILNTGATEMVQGGALHTYFSIVDIGQVVVSGLDGCDYHDQLDGMRLKRQAGGISFGEEVDRIYVGTPAPCLIDDPAGGRRIRVGKEGSESTVVWNPWIAKAARMADYPDDGYKTMVCIETANAGSDQRTLAPGAEHTLTQTVSLA